MDSCGGRGEAVQLYRMCRVLLLHSKCRSSAPAVHYYCRCSVAGAATACKVSVSSLSACWALTQVAAQFRRHRAAPPLPPNAAPHSGAIMWMRGLRDRIIGADCGVRTGCWRKDKDVNDASTFLQMSRFTEDCTTAKLIFSKGFSENEPVAVLFVRELGRQCATRCRPWHPTANHNSETDVFHPIAGPMVRLQALLRGAGSSEEARAMGAAHERLAAEMADFEHATLEDWCSVIASVSEATLKQPLLTCGAGLSHNNTALRLPMCIRTPTSAQPLKSTCRVTAATRL